ncbi:hypothetical protein [Parablautia sp. Marseille-Q6255]|uniref:hypothetical protein n=1 Tax=Parablautia sp. Marseille-Q6255 TaxID=3039593 RepID=UPI0024BC2C10|nr:hypothetical protein [Parablautia sp. Marseille-Q6255]
MEAERRRITLLIFTALAGLLAGSAIPELFRMGTGDYSGLLSLYSLGKYEATEVAAARLFPYIVSVRVPVLLFLWMSCYTPAGFLFHLGYIWWLSASAGMLLSVFLIRDGYEGLLLFGCCLFPQWIIYASMWRRELQVLLRHFDQRGGGSRPWASLPASAAESYSGKILTVMQGSVRRELSEFFVLLGNCFLGCAAEAFLGIWTLKIYLGLFR